MSPIPRRSGVVHAVAECRTCDVTWENYKNALACGAAHAKRTGHTVRCEQAIAVTYNP